MTVLGRLLRRAPRDHVAHGAPSSPSQGPSPTPSTSPEGSASASQPPAGAPVADARDRAPDPQVSQPLPDPPAPPSFAPRGIMAVPLYPEEPTQAPAPGTPRSAPSPQPAPQVVAASTQAVHTGTPRPTPQDVAPQEPAQTPDRGRQQALASLPSNAAGAEDLGTGRRDTPGPEGPSPADVAASPATGQEAVGETAAAPMAASPSDTPREPTASQELAAPATDPAAAPAVPPQDPTPGPRTLAVPQPSPSREPAPPADPAEPPVQEPVPGPQEPDAPSLPTPPAETHTTVLRTSTPRADLATSVLQVPTRPTQDTTALPTPAADHQDPGTPPPTILPRRAPAQPDEEEDDGPPVYAPRPARRRRLLRRSLITLVVLALLAAAGLTGAELYVRSSLDRVAHQALPWLPGDATITTEGLLLPQVLSSRLRTVGIQASSVTLPTKTPDGTGTMTLNQVDARATGLALDSPYPARRLSVEGTLSWDEVGRLARARTDFPKADITAGTVGTASSPGTMTATGHVLAWDVTLTLEPSVTPDGALTVTVTQASLRGVPLPLEGSFMGKTTMEWLGMSQTSATIGSDSLPPGLRFTSATVTDAGLRVTVSGQDVSLSS